MRLNYRPLGPFIRQVDIRNKNLDVETLLGVSVQKKFIPSIANTVGTDFTKYKIVKRGQFTYIPDTSRRGDKIGLAMLDSEDIALVSQAYTVFKIIDHELLDPEYLMMWFRRPEFDRYARFKSHGSVREIFDWDEMCETELPIPHIDKQREIVKEFNTIQNRIALNHQLIQKLEESAEAIYKEWFVEGIDLENLPEGWRFGLLRDLCSYSQDRISIIELSLENYISTENMLKERGGVTIANNLPNVSTTTGFEIGNILISNIRPYFKKVWLANFDGGCSNDVLCLVPKSNIPSLYLYQVVEKDDFFEYVMAGSKGTKMPRGDKKWIMDYPAVIPDKELLKKFNKLATTIQNKIYIKKSENQKLMELKELLLSKLATVE